MPSSPCPVPSRRTASRRRCREGSRRGPAGARRRGTMAVRGRISSANKSSRSICRTHQHQAEEQARDDGEHVHHSRRAPLDRVHDHPPSHERLFCTRKVQRRVGGCRIGVASHSHRSRGSVSTPRTLCWGPCFFRKHNREFSGLVGFSRVQSKRAHPIPLTLNSVTTPSSELKSTSAASPSPKATTETIASA